MITYDSALKAVLDSVRPLDTERIELDQSIGRVLAEPIAADMDMPPFDKSAMDGFACRRQDLEQELCIVETIPAGRMPSKPIGPGECARIMTGAPVPVGADTVVMVEHTRLVAEDRVAVTRVQQNSNICKQGEDIRTGDILLEAGERITPAHIAVLASLGATCPLVSRRPSVAVMATGSELVEPYEKATGAMIRNSNSYQLCAQVRAMGGVAHYAGIVADRPDDTDRAIKKARKNHDLILISGGVSMGDYDFVPSVLRANGFEFLFDSVAMQPGRPTIFGVSDGCYVCGLPGNPVSTFVIFEILIKPFLFRLMGHDYAPVCVEARLSHAVSRRNAKRQSSVPVRLPSPGVATPLEYHGSAHINAFSKADGLITIPVGTRELPEGSVVNVRPL